MSTTIKAGASAAKINKVLKQGGEIVIKKGTYDLDRTLTVYSGTIVTCEKGVVFNRKHGGRMLSTYINTSVGKYNGVHDVIWKGGTFKANTNSSAAIVIVICHAKNIVFDGVTIDGCINLHSFEINSSTDVKILNCTMKNQTFKKGEEHKEAIQIDYSYKGGLSITGATADSPCYDDTHCKGVEIGNCTFTNVPNGVGTHVVSEKEEYHTNIDIHDCTFTSIKKNAIRLLGMKNVTINNNVGAAPVVVDKVSKAHTSHGKVSIPTRYNLNVTINDVLVK